MTIFPFSLCLFLSAVGGLKWKEFDDDRSRVALEHHIGMSKFCGLSLVVLVLCWSPYAALYLWPVAFGGAGAVNLYLSLAPPPAAAAAPLLNGLLALETVPRVRAALAWDPAAEEEEMPPELEGGTEPLLEVDT